MADRDPSPDRQQALAAFLRGIVRDRRIEPGLDTPLVSSGLVDSLSLIAVLNFVEDRFGVVIPDEAATAESMDSLRHILALVEAHERR